MVFRLCDGLTLFTCKRVCRSFSAIIETDAALKCVTFGRLPMHIMIKVLRSLAFHVEQEAWGRDRSRHVFMFEAVNTTYRALLRQHPEVTPLVFRGGRVYTSLKRSGIKPRDLAVHPILNDISGFLYNSPGDFTLSTPHMKYGDIDSYIVDKAAMRDFATRPPTTKLFIDWFDANQQDKLYAVENESGVTVADFMDGYCGIPAPSERHKHHLVLSLVCINGIEAGCPVLGLAHDT